MIDVLLDPATDLRLLRVLKGRWKAFSAGTPDGAEHAGAIALYYAAIAAALVHRGTRITQYPPAKLAEAFSSLLEKPWLPHGLRRLMKTARLRCADQA